MGTTWGTPRLRKRVSSTRRKVSTTWSRRRLNRRCRLQLTNLSVEVMFKHAGRFELSDVCLAFNCEAIRGWPSPRFSFSSTEGSRGGGAVGGVAGCFHPTFFRDSTGIRALGHSCPGFFVEDLLRTSSRKKKTKKKKKKKKSTLVDTTT